VPAIPECRVFSFDARDLNSHTFKKFHAAADRADRITIYVPREWKHYDAARRSLHVLAGNPDRRSIIEGFRDGIATRILAGCWILAVSHHRYVCERNEDSGGMKLEFSRCGLGT
jgi:hypothetical protein